MLRRNPSEVSSARKTELDSFEHDNDKGSKMKRQKDSQTKAIFCCLAIIALLGLLAKVRVNHMQRYVPRRLRKQSNHHIPGENKVGNSNTKSANDFLPPNSLYKLKVEDIHGKIVNFSSFRGMVTLIVNVACS
ncbi:unnamed protein product [Pseudo-nitzschia multistriata]|uniref:Glutathione peroxidase n=1 Tax=Pseudo-nitzschia multistriata TaxID=183589 RepID=A0A448ZL89_9STRA|nr:unnamed protein product [Pseudo-nitzschia multistriata]